MNRIGFWSLACGLVATCWGCSGDDERAPGVGDCNGVLCGTAGGGSVTPKPDAAPDTQADSADEDAAVAVVDLAGSVMRLTDEGFSQEFPFDGWGYLRVPTASGDEEVGFGGDAGLGFAATGVVTGSSWFTVVPDASFHSLVMPTHAYLQVPDEAPTSFSIPLVDRDVLTTVYAMLAPPAVVRADAAHVIVVFEKSGQRVSGVSVTAHPTAEAVAFDQGIGYASDATETGINGAVVLVNVIGTGPLRWKQSDGTEGTLTLVHVTGQASFVRIALP